MTESATNAVLRDCPIGSIVRMHRKARGSWKVVGADDGRVILRNLLDLRETTLNGAASVYFVCDPDDEEFEPALPCSCDNEPYHLPTCDRVNS